jgi:hypothetical protein
MSLSGRIALGGSQGCPSYRQPIDPEGGLAHAYRHRLPFFAAGTDPRIERVGWARFALPNNRDRGR